MAGRCPPLGRLAAAWTRGRLVGGTDRRILGGVLFEQPSGQFLGQGAGAPLALVKGDELVLLVGIKHKFKDCLGLLEPLLTKTLAGVERVSSHAQHGGKGLRETGTQLAILPGRRSCRYGNRPGFGAVVAARHRARYCGRGAP